MFINNLKAQCMRISFSLQFMQKKKEKKIDKDIVYNAMLCKIGMTVRNLRLIYNSRALANSSMLSIVHNNTKHRYS
jgi:urease accessory protein UreE